MGVDVLVHVRLLVFLRFRISDRKIFHFPLHQRGNTNKKMYRKTHIHMMVLALLLSQLPVCHGRAQLPRHQPIYRRRFLHYEVSVEDLFRQERTQSRSAGTPALGYNLAHAVAFPHTGVTPGTFPWCHSIMTYIAEYPHDRNGSDLSAGHCDRYDDLSQFYAAFAMDRNQRPACLPTGWYAHATRYDPNGRWVEPTTPTDYHTLSLVTSHLAGLPPHLGILPNKEIPADKLPTWTAMCEAALPKFLLAQQQLLGQVPLVVRFEKPIPGDVYKIVMPYVGDAPTSGPDESATLREIAALRAKVARTTVIIKDRRSRAAGSDKAAFTRAVEHSNSTAAAVAVEHSNSTAAAAAAVEHSNSSTAAAAAVEHNSSGAAAVEHINSTAAAAVEHNSSSGTAAVENSSGSGAAAVEYSSSGSPLTRLLTLVRFLFLQDPYPDNIGSRAASLEDMPTFDPAAVPPTVGWSLSSSWSSSLLFYGVTWSLMALCIGIIYWTRDRPLPPIVAEAKADAEAAEKSSTRIVPRSVTPDLSQLTDKQQMVYEWCTLHGKSKRGAFKWALQSPK